MKTVKTIFFILIVFLTSCDPLYHILMVNNYHEPIILASPELNCISLYPDTTLQMDVEIERYLSSEIIRSHDTDAFYEYVAPSIEDIFCDNDTMSIYIFNADTVEFYSWDTVIKYNMVLQRYDLSRQDFFDRNESWKWYQAWLFFPPTDAMKHIRMWPPYGTYDEH